MRNNRGGSTSRAEELLAPLLAPLLSPLLALALTLSQPVSSASLSPLSHNFPLACS
jgi:hypothetical protein